MIHILHAKTGKEVPGKLSRVRFIYMPYREVDIHIRKHTGTFGRIHPFELYQSGRIRTKTIFFHKKGNENTVKQTNKVVAIGTIKNIVRKGE